MARIKIQTENRLVDTTVEKEGGANWERSTETHTRPYVKYKAAQSHLWPVTTGLDGADFGVFPSTRETSLTQDQCCPVAVCDDKNVLYLHQLNFHLKWVL